MVIGARGPGTQISAGVRPHRRAENQPKKRRMRGCEFQITKARGDQPFPGIIGGCGLACLHLGQKLVEAAHCQRIDQPRQIAEMMRRGRMADASARRRLAQRKSRQTGLGQLRLARSQQRVAQIAVVIAGFFPSGGKIMLRSASLRKDYLDGVKITSLVYVDAVQML